MKDLLQPYKESLNASAKFSLKLQITDRIESLTVCSYDNLKYEDLNQTLLENALKRLIIESKYAIQSPDKITVQIEFTHEGELHSDSTSMKFDNYQYMPDAIDRMKYIADLAIASQLEKIQNQIRLEAARILHSKYSS